MRLALAYLLTFLLGGLSLLAGAAQAAGCAAGPDHSAALSRLIAGTQAARSEAEAQQFSVEMWELWADAPDEAAQAVLYRGMRKRARFDLLGAEADFDRLIAYCPEYAEGWNQRAFVRFMQGQAAPALKDLDRALALSPRHVGALAGKAMVLLELGQRQDARLALEAALALNPWLPERRFMRLLADDELEL